MKICSKCKLEQPLENFNREHKRLDGYYPWCKVCLSEHRRKRYIKRPKYFFIHNKVCSFCKEDKPRSEFGIRESSRNLKNRCLSYERIIKENLTAGKRRCGSCKEFKLIEEFFKSRRDGHHSTCIECSRKGYVKNVVLNLSEREKRRNKDLIKYYGITLAQYQELLNKQNYVCPVCLKPLEGISNHVDHAHRGQHEGKIRAILHSRCNQMVMHNHYDANELRRAADLIDNPLTDWIVPEEYLKSRKKKRHGKRRIRKRVIHRSVNN